MKNLYTTILLILSLSIATPALARTKLVALPDRENTFIRLDHPDITLIQEERTLSMHKGLNQIDFFWKGVHIDPDSIRLTILQHPDSTRLINVSYPPNEQALDWEIFSPDNQQEKIRISYLLSNIDRVITYEAKTNHQENKLNLSSYLVLRNFSGESFASALFQLDYGKDFEKSILDGETRRMLFFEAGNLNIRKIFTFNAGIHPWEPEEEIRIDIENFKGTPATLKVIEPMQGEWDIKKSSHDFKHVNSKEIEFELNVPAKGKSTVTYSYVRQNIRS